MTVGTLSNGLLLAAAPAWPNSSLSYSFLGSSSNQNDFLSSFNGVSTGRSPTLGGQNISYFDGYDPSGLSAYDQNLTNFTFSNFNYGASAFNCSPR